MPGLITPVSKAPPRVAVWLTLLELEKVTVLPLATVSVGGWKAKLLMSTVAPLLALAVGPEAPALWMPASISPKATAITPISCHPCRDFVPVIAPAYGAPLALVQTSFIIGGCTGPGG